MELFEQLSLSLLWKKCAYRIGEGKRYTVFSWADVSIALTKTFNFYLKDMIAE